MSDPTTLGLLYDKLVNIEYKLDKVIECNTRVKIKLENHEGRILHMADRVQCHEADPRKHYNPHYNESISERLYRKKTEIGVAGALGTVASILLIILERII